MPATYKHEDGGHDGVYFGAIEQDWGGFHPTKWFKTHAAGILKPFDEIKAARCLYELNSGPPAEGIYFLFTDDELQYIGLSREISTRLHRHAYPNWPAHVKVSWLTHFSAIWVPLRFLEAVEGYYLHLLRPPRNSRFLPPHAIITSYLP